MTTDDEETTTVIYEYTTKRCEHVTARRYENVVAAFESSVTDAESGQFTNLVNTAESKRDWESRLTEMFGPSGFLRVFSLDHGQWLRLYGVSAKAKKYVFGNPLVAFTMVEHDIRAAGQVPLSLVIYQAPDGSTRVAYDLPSSAMSFIDNDELAAAAAKLDRKLVAFIEDITGSVP